MSAQLRALHARPEVHHLRAGVIASRVALRRVHSDHVFPARLRRPPQLQTPVFRALDRRRQLLDSPLDDLPVKDAFAAGAKTALGVFRVLFRKSRSEVRSHLPPERDLLPVQPELLRQRRFFPAQLADPTAGQR